VIHMAFSYDNSTNNIRNPSNPPRRVQYGLQTTDEMANLAVLLRFKTRLDLDKFTAKYQYKVVRGMLEYNKIALKRDPNDAVAHAHLGKALLALGQKQEAETELKKALALKPSLDDAHYHLGLIFQENKNSAQAKEEYELTLLHNPDHIGARNNLGLFYLNEGDLAAAESHFKYALNIAPDDQLLQKNLRLVQQARASRKRTSNP
jgi:Tfp pilus assembly protein PilF